MITTFMSRKGHSTCVTIFILIAFQIYISIFALFLQMINFINSKGQLLPGKCAQLQN